MLQVIENRAVTMNFVLQVIENRAVTMNFILQVTESIQSLTLLKEKNKQFCACEDVLSCVQYCIRITEVG
jgi:hypothetical protein